MTQFNTESCRINSTSLADEEEGSFFFAFLRDIGERKSIESALKQSQEQLRIVNDNAPDYIFRIGRDGTISYVNHTPPGVSMDEILGSNLRQWMQPEYHKAFEDAAHLAFEDVEVTEFEGKGAVTGRIYSNRIKPVVSDQRVDSAILVAHDITERKRISLELAESHKKFARLFHAANEGIAMHELVFDEFGKPVDYYVTDVNFAYERITGIAKKDAVGKLASSLYGGAPLSYLDIFSEIAINGKSTSFETYFPPADKYLHIAAFSPGKNMFITLISDISDRRHAEERIRQHQEKLERFNKMAVGREMRMVELKKEINTLLARLGLENKYSIHESGSSDEE